MLVSLLSSVYVAVGSTSLVCAVRSVSETLAREDRNDRRTIACPSLRQSRAGTEENTREGILRESANCAL